jgi:predicted nicotinamide N-methyase
VPEDLVTKTIELPRGELTLQQPREAVEVPDVGPVEWAPMAPYWTVFWRSGVALARELEAVELRGLRVVEVGCGLGVPSIAAARAGAEVLATDVHTEALGLVERNAQANGVKLETAIADWSTSDELIRRPLRAPERRPAAGPAAKPRAGGLARRSG